MTTKLLSRTLGMAVALMAALGACVGEATECAPLPQPAGTPILTVSGDLGVRNAGDRAVFDRLLLETLPQIEFATWTPWTGQGAVRFSGVLIADLLERLCASGQRIVASALNDYRIEIPLSDLDRYDVLVALRRNGEVMPVRDKGPLWIIYRLAPGEPLPPEIERRMVWQLEELTVQ
jgi:hypothetical protein